MFSDPRHATERRQCPLAEGFEKIGVETRARRFMKDASHATRSVLGDATSLDVPEAERQKAQKQLDRIKTFSDREGKLPSRPNEEKFAAMVLDPTGKSMIRAGPKVSYSLVSSYAHAMKTALDWAIPSPLVDGERPFPGYLHPEWMLYTTGRAYGFAADQAAEFMGWDSELWRVALAEPIDCIIDRFEAARQDSSG